MKPFKGFLVILLLLFLPALVSADGLYLSAGGGGTWEDSATAPGTGTNFDTGRNFHGAVGYQYKFFKIEAEYLNIRSDFKTFQVPGGFKVAQEPENTPKEKTNSRPTAGVLEESVIMFNAYLVAPWTLKPYIGGGGGDRRYQIIAGVEYPLSSAFALAVQYRYYNGQSQNVSGVLTFYFK